MRVEVLLKSDKCTISAERLPDGKIRVKTSAWDDAKVLLPDEVLELRWRQGQINLLRKPRIPDEFDRPKDVGPYGEDIEE